ncbi:MAG: translocation protein TolB, partial [Flavobacteriaceae bacterium]|nr:translocation protein TolB [Flavobacteriaceae bacterium]
PDWSPDGLWLVYTAGSKGNYNLYKINIITKERVQLTNTSGRNENPVWKK